ncbi:hypothetical protein [Mesorhizobium sp. M1163]|uniref:hypothetical protein n=1 Tax=unclassified Mesorhizobium TaxID=325217 RepID=UPI003339903E
MGAVAGLCRRPAGDPHPQPWEPDGAVRGFMLVEWRDEQVVQIRDFRYAPWCLVDAEISTIER